MLSVLLRVFFVLLSIFAGLIRPAALHAERIGEPEPEWRLPLHLTLPATTTVFVQGRRFGGEVSFYRDDGDTVRIAGSGHDVAIWPQPLAEVAAGPPDRAKLAQLYGRVPWVLDRLTGDSAEEWARVAGEYREMRREMLDAVIGAHGDALIADPVDRAGAMAAAEEALAPYLHLLSEERNHYAIGPSSMVLFVEGGPPGGLSVLLGAGTPAEEPPAQQDRIIDDALLRKLLVEFQHLAFPDRSGEVVMIYTHRGLRALSDELAVAALHQIEGGRAAPDGPLRPAEVEPILARLWEKGGAR